MFALKFRTVTDPVELFVAAEKLKLSKGFVMAIRELRISGVLGLEQNPPEPSTPNKEDGGIFKLNILLLLFFN